jgi:hypothetical protein
MSTSPSDHTAPGAKTLREGAAAGRRIVEDSTSVWRPRSWEVDRDLVAETLTMFKPREAPAD